jgi:hypothetical protein
MDRKEFALKLIGLGACPFMFSLSNRKIIAGELSETKQEDCDAVIRQKEFMENWLTDLLGSIESTVDRETKVKIIEGCGRGCFHRHKFKTDIAAKGAGDLDKLIEAYSNNFEIWKENGKVHIRFGETSNRCYCPVVQNIPPKPDDLHCECSRSTHQAIFETALGKPFKTEIVESLRRGGKTCHFIVNLA